MQAINLYYLTRLNEQSMYSTFESCLSQRETKNRIHVEEFEQLKVLVSNLHFREKRWDIWRQKKDISHQIPRDHKIGSVVDKK